MRDLTRTVPLDLDSWDAFARMVERNGGIYGGCWCAGFHSDWHRDRENTPDRNRELKRRLVAEGRARAALVLDATGEARGWCQYGTPEELGRIKHRREYERIPPPSPDWRLACIFVDRTHRGRGVARTAVTAALGQIAAAGGGRVEAISEVTAGRRAQGRFLFSATVELFESLGFDRARQVGKHAWILARQVDPS